MQSAMILTLLGGLLLIVLSLVPTGEMGAADIVFVLTSYFVVNGYLRNIGWQVRNLQKSVNELDDLVQFSKLEPQVADVDGAKDFVPGPGSIIVKDVKFKFDESECVSACAALERDPEGKTYVDNHLACFAQASSCEEVYACNFDF